MFNISFVLKEYKPQEKNLPRSHYAELIGEFEKKLNLDRKLTNWKRYKNWLRENKWTDSKENQDKFRKHKLFLKPLSAKYIAQRMAVGQINNTDLLHWFMGYCNEAKNFSAAWWWSLSSKNVK